MIVMAMDRSVRSYDEDNRLHVSRMNISKAMVCPYRGAEIPRSAQMGLDPNRIYQLFRDPVELEAGASTFNNLPILIKHVHVTADEHEPDLVVGSTGSECVFNYPYLQNSISVWAGHAIEGIETGQQKEFSAAYRYDADMTPGEHMGVKYDGIMRNIRGNHGALVEKGRAGADVVVGDSLMEISRMLTSRKALMASGVLLHALPPLLAQDTRIDVEALLKGVTAKNWGRAKPRILKAVSDKLAQDASIDGLKLAMDSLDDVKDDDKKTAEDANEKDPDEDDDDKKPKAKTAEDEKDEDKPMPKAAMDAAIKLETGKAVAATVARMNAIRDAERIVRPIIGEITVAMDSAEDIYKLALDHLKVDVTGLAPEAYGALLKAIPTVAPAPRVAMDSAPAAGYSERFAAAARVKRA